MQGLEDRICNKPSIRRPGAFSRSARSQFSERSDLDVRIIRQPGFTDAIRACWFVLKERTRAFFSGYSLDICVLDSERPLEKLRANESPVTLHRQKSLDIGEREMKTNQIGNRDCVVWRRWEIRRAPIEVWAFLWHFASLFRPRGAAVRGT